MSVQSTLQAARDAQEQLFLDACTITRLTGQTLGDDNAYVDDFDVIYSGRCRLKVPTTDPSQAQVGEQSVTVRRNWLDLPWDAPGPVLVNDIVTMTACDDAWALATQFTVLDAGMGSSTKRRLTVEARS